MKDSEQSYSIFLVGIGMGNADTLTARAREKIAGAKLVIGARRMIESVKSIAQAEKAETYDTEKIVSLISDFCSQHDEKSAEKKSCCVLFSGDTGFFSGASALSQRLSEKKIDFELIPGISTCQYFSSRIKKPHQHWNIVSLHAESSLFLPEIMGARETFFLLGGKTTENEIIKSLMENSFTGSITVAFNMGHEDESIFHLELSSGTICETDIPPGFLDVPHPRLCAMLVENSDFLPRTAVSIPDGDFERTDGVPMTKRITRSAILSILSPKDGETVWDVGAGTGAVSIDIARNSKCALFSVEEKKSAVKTLKANKEKFNALNMKIVEGKAPAALESLPAPDAVFVGGSGGELFSIVGSALKKNGKARILVAAVTLETLSACQEISQKDGLEIYATQISSAATRTLGRYHGMSAENPVWLVSLGRA